MTGTGAFCDVTLLLFKMSGAYGSCRFTREQLIIYIYQSITCSVCTLDLHVSLWTRYLQIGQTMWSTSRHESLIEVGWASDIVS